MTKAAKQKDDGVTYYSDELVGDRGNYWWSARYDVTRGHLGISQTTEKGRPTERVLLSPYQIKELKKFLETYNL